MKLTLPLLRAAAFGLTLATLTACSSKSDDAKPAAGPGVSWTVDGNNVTATAIKTFPQSGNLFEFAGARTLSATSSTAVDIILPKAVGTYPIPGTGANAITAVYIDVAPNVSPGGYVGISGSVTVTSVSATNVTGTFTFTGTDSFTGVTLSKTITNGQFNIAL